MKNPDRDEITRRRRADRTCSYPSGKRVDITDRSLDWAEKLQNGREVRVLNKKTAKMITPRLNPDAVCGLERTNEDGSKSYLMPIIEADRTSEPVRSLDFTRKSFLKNYLQYKQFLSSGQYKDFFKAKKVPAMVLYVTARAPRVNTMKNTILEFTPKGSPFMLLQHAEGFAGFVKPQPVLHHLFNGPYQRAGCPSSEYLEQITL